MNTKSIWTRALGVAIALCAFVATAHAAPNKAFQLNTAKKASLKNCECGIEKGPLGFFQCAPCPETCEDGKFAVMGLCLEVKVDFAKDGLIDLVSVFPGWQDSDANADTGDTGDTGGPGDTGGDTGGGDTGGGDTGGPGGGDVDWGEGDCPTDVETTEIPCDIVGGILQTDTSDTGGSECTCTATSWCEVDGEGVCMCYTAVNCN